MTFDTMSVSAKRPGPGEYVKARGKFLRDEIAWSSRD